MKIIRPAHTEYHEELNLEYRFRNDPEAGFTFPWKDGKVVLNKLSEKNFMWCLEHPEEVESLGVVKRKSSCSVPALARCECGEEIFRRQILWLLSMYELWKMVCGSWL